MVPVFQTLDPSVKCLCSREEFLLPYSHASGLLVIVSVMASRTTDETPKSDDAPVAEKSKEKITIMFKATGDAPILKQRKFLIDPTKDVAWLLKFLRRQLKLQLSDALFLYVSQSFVPPPDQVIKNLYDCFGTDRKLIFNYSLNPAWG
eukprot:scpid91095/ scgid34897/ Autophagy protein 12-like